MDSARVGRTVGDARLAVSALRSRRASRREEATASGTDAGSGDTAADTVGWSCVGTGASSSSRNSRASKVAEAHSMTMRKRSAGSPTVARVRIMISPPPGRAVTVKTGLARKGTPGCADEPSSRARMHCAAIVSPRPATNPITASNGCPTADLILRSPRESADAPTLVASNTDAARRLLIDKYKTMLTDPRPCGRAALCLSRKIPLARQ